MNIVIIGYGVASHWACKTIRKYSPDSNIIIITNEQTPTYYKVYLADYLAGKISLPQMYPPDMQTPDNHLQIHMGKQVMKIDTAGKSVLLQTGESIAYDKLLIATGAETKLNTDLKKISGIFTLNSIKDTNTLMSFNGKVKKSVIVGDNIHLFEIIRALRSLDSKITVILKNKRLFQDYLNEKGTGFINNLLDDVEFILNTEIINFIPHHNQLKAIELSNGKIIDADLAIINGPLEPNLDFLGLDSKICVDYHMRTEYPDIYAAGDVCICMDEYPEFSIGWRRAWLQGITAATNILGHEKTYCAVQSIRGKTKAYPFIIMGNPVSALKNCDVIEYIDTDKKIFKQIYHKNNLMLSAVFIGSIENISLIEEMVQNQEIIDQSIHSYIKQSVHAGNNHFIELVCPVCKSNLDISTDSKTESKLNCPICAVELQYSYINDIPEISLCF